jgi:hypothetical protein
MKRFFSYGLLIAALILSVVMTSTRVWKKDLTSRNSQFVYLSHNASPSGKTYFLTIPDTPSVPAGLNLLSNSRLPVIIAQAENNPYSMLKSCFSKRTIQQLNTTKAIYISLYSQKEKEGYYIYALRKLRI